jgi:hypothetical protein
MNSAADQQTGGEPYAGLPSVGHYEFRTLVDLRDTALARALSRLARETDSDDITVAAFGNFAPDDPQPTNGPGVAVRSA